MITPITIKNITIGAGRVKICVPITGINELEIKSQISRIKESDADVIEWRADYFEDIFNLEELTRMLSLITQELHKYPLIFTFRTKQEGGSCSKISSVMYIEILKEVINSKLADIIDIELFTGDDLVLDLITSAHKAGIKVILSNHDFDKTPDQVEIVSRLLKMQKLDADILKIAVMPNSKKDVITLLSATEEMVTNFANRPVITISMSKDGFISRLSGEIFGSCITFASSGSQSAPGQIDSKDLKGILKIIHKNYAGSNVFLIGFMGSGKTTVSYELSSITGMQEIDTDHLIEENEKMQIKDIFEKYGEEYFRNIETKTLSQIIKNDCQIVSCGGGIVIKDENIELMKDNGKIVLLTAKPDTILKRVESSSTRPILNGNMNIEFIETLMNKRLDRYIQLADIIIETDNKEVYDICNEILLNLDDTNKK